MNLPRIITIAGKPGSGKSSTAKGVASALGYTHFSSGDFMRKIAADRNISLAELGAIAENDPTIDEMIDAENKKMRERDRVVIDSRLAFHWIPDSFKVYLNLDLQIAADRIARDQTDARRASGEEVSNRSQAFESLMTRFESEQKRYRTLYNIDPGDLTNYNLVIDTGTKPLEETIGEIATKYRERCSANGVEV